jgi:5-methyltetrahydropteroyltriglutamate--homocysteine methyltransferase
MKLYGADSGSNERILTTHVGSLIRPPELISFHEKKLNNEPFDEAAYNASLKHAVAAVVKQQAETGIDIVSDGEFGKNVSWSRYVIERLSGFEQRPGGVGSIKATAGKDRRDFAEFYAEFEAEKGFVGMGKSFAKTGLFYVTGPIKYTDAAFINRDIENLKSALAYACRWRVSAGGRSGKRGAGSVRGILRKRRRIPARDSRSTAPRIQINH